MSAPDFIKVHSKTFEAELFEEGSWGSRDIAGKHTCTMELFFRTDDTGFIEWDIPSLERSENIGLWFEIGVDGTRTLSEYDGVMSLPGEAVDVMREAGVVVPNEFDDGCTFKYDDGRVLDYWDFLRSAAEGFSGDEAKLTEWAVSAKVGDKFEQWERVS